MSDRVEVRILVRTLSDGRRELSLLDPRTGRESRTDHKVHVREADAAIRTVKAQCERNGLWVSQVKWLD